MKWWVGRMGDSPAGESRDTFLAVEVWEVFDESPDMPR